ncbi:hypothetical protein OGAPHI_003962 [Ogataea philodendri]|uniref:Peptidase S54 rhomboid domain-containing protein n=1 Tax=Ogataea philodendri TaxID=1378263 RepID=A0A9P8P6Y5_9ASCO|nr:uncharacterized protein OGAPHI_003962 [Ogataea philodendri]KAH3665774.1 hypothetical protein OGAPHI_003962 [Ogataea philodendri]
MRRMGNPRISNSVYKALVFTLGFSVGCYFATPYLFTYTPLSYFKRHPQQLLFGLIGVNVGVFLLWRARTVGLRTMNVLNKYFLLERGPSRTTQWSLLWSGFSHENFTHLLMNMFCLYSFGSTMIQVLGVVNFTSLYLISGVGASFASILFSAATGSFGLSLGASGAISAVFAAFATIFPKAGIAFFFLPIPGGAQMALLAFTVYNALGCVYKWGGLDYAAHLGGTFLGYLYAKKLQRERRYR